MPFFSGVRSSTPSSSTRQRSKAICTASARKNPHKRTPTTKSTELFDARAL
jgi:hypothetical protein